MLDDVITDNIKTSVNEQPLECTTSNTGRNRNI
jgi:hypothetical protein